MIFIYCVQFIFRYTLSSKNLLKNKKITPMTISDLQKKKVFDQVGCQHSICCVSEGMFDFDHLIFIIINSFEERV